MGLVEACSAKAQTLQERRGVKKHGPRHLSCNLESEWTGRYQQSAIDPLQEPCYCSSVVQDWHPALMKETKQCIAIREAASRHWQERKRRKKEGERKDKIREKTFGSRCKNF
ncbi:uncharacterized [Tachysurus ichikawai]